MECTNGYAAAPIISLVVLAVTMFLNFTNGAVDLGIFDNEVGDLSDKYKTDFTPSGWTFSIWGFIYAYQVILVIYWLTLLCRKNPTTGEPLYKSPMFMSPWIAVVYVINLGLNIGWLFLWDQEELTAAFAVLLLISVTLYICMGISFYGLASNKDEMIKQGLGLEIRLVIGIVHNGFGIYATWTTIATLLNFAIYLTYEEELVTAPIASTISLMILAFEIVLFALLDHTLLEKYTRYLYTPYIVIHVALAGSLDKNYDTDNPNTIMTIGLLVIGAVATILKVITSIYRTRTQPLYDESAIKPTV